MTLPRPLARLLAVVIVLIAACVSASVVGASSAQAHQGHAHQGRAHVEKVTVAAALTLAEARNVAQGARLTAADTDEAPTARPCNGLCCLMGASCCVPGLLPESLAAIPGLTAARRLIAAADALPAGIAPDSPARPPRSFA